MKIVSHRGFWIADHEKNTNVSFDRAVKNKFGIETDIRDRLGSIVISHDLPLGTELNLINFLNSIPEASYRDLNLALNVKSDGLAGTIKTTILKYPNLQYFLFDMSIPDTFDYIRHKLPFYSRMSEYEKTPAFISASSGVWLDSFDSDWFDAPIIQQLLNLEKSICIVSPELHGRDYTNVWNLLKSFASNKNLMICTDYPDRAANYFKT